MNRFQLSRALILGAALALGANSSHAQPALAQASAAKAAPDLQMVPIQLKNAPSELVAYWLDPARNPVPTQLRQSGLNSSPWARELESLPRQPGNGNGPRGLKLPDGIKSVVSVDPQNVLLVQGTSAGIGGLRKLVTEIDVPLKQVEVEAQFLQMSPQTLKTLPLKFAKNKDPFYAPSVALVPPTMSLSGELNKLIADNKVRVITAPRVTAIDGLTAQLTSTEMRSAMLSSDAKKFAGMSPDELQWLPGVSMVQIETGFNCTPIFHGDSIKLLTQSTLNDRSVNVSANLRDGETFAILMPADKSNVTDRIVVLVTARVVRRAGDEIAAGPKAGTIKLGSMR